MNIHNDFFITTLKDKKNAQDFLKEALPKEITSLINFENLEYCDNTYILPDFKNYFSDMVIKTTIKEQPADIYFLLEHKSTPPKANELFLQILSYIFAMFQEDHKNKKDFRIVLPLVFYHGVQKWNIPTEFKELFKVDAIFKDNILNFNYTLYDTANLNLETGDYLDYNLKLKSSLIALKSAFDKKDLNSALRVLDNLYQIGAFNHLTDFEPFIIYLIYTKNITKEKFIQLVQSKNKKGGEIMLTFEAYFTEKGIEKGIQKGRREGRQEGKREGIKEEKISSVKNLKALGVDLEIIAKATGLSIEEVKRL